VFESPELRVDELALREGAVEFLQNLLRSKRPLRQLTVVSAIPCDVLVEADSQLRKAREEVQTFIHTLHMLCLASFCVQLLKRYADPSDKVMRLIGEGLKAALIAALGALLVLGVTSAQEYFQWTWRMY
jgi:hypothetical protein